MRLQKVFGLIVYCCLTSQIDISVENMAKVHQSMRLHSESRIKPCWRETYKQNLQDWKESEFIVAFTIWWKKQTKKFIFKNTLSYDMKLICTNGQYSKIKRIVFMLNILNDYGHVQCSKIWWLGKIFHRNSPYIVSSLNLIALKRDGSFFWSDYPNFIFCFSS